MTTLHLKTENGLLEKIHRPGTILLNPYACALMLQALDGVWRFMDNKIVTALFRETTAAHTERTEERVASMADRASTNPGFLIPIKKTLATQVTGHDFGEFIIEPMTAYGETDPVLKKELEFYSDFEFFAGCNGYYIALCAHLAGQPELFTDFVTELRDRTIPKNLGNRVLTGTELIAFYKSASDLIQKKVDEISKHPKLQNNAAKHAIAHDTMIMVENYNAIEREMTFEGRLGKIVEKCDGTAYQAAISKFHADSKSSKHHYHQPGFISATVSLARYEKNLYPFYQVTLEQKKFPEEHLKMALNAIDFAYETSHTVISQSKPIISIAKMEEPGFADPHDVHTAFVANYYQGGQYLDPVIDANQHPILKRRDKIMGLYEEAREALTRGVLRLPEHNKSLAVSATVTTIETPLYQKKLFSTP